ncbi:MAG: hypothetical protein ACLU37_07240 [Collinsella sp.]
MGAGIVLGPGRTREAEYRAAHNELVASAWATKIAHEVDPRTGWAACSPRKLPLLLPPRTSRSAGQEPGGPLLRGRAGARALPGYALKMSSARASTWA